MKLEKHVASFNTTAYGHPAEDAWALHQFTHASSVVAVGCVSDGCTGDINDSDYQPELGAMWLSRQFVTEAESLYAQGLRGEGLGTQIVLRLGAAMRDYQPQSKRSKWCQDGAYRYSDELIATVLGFVADDDQLVQVLSGDGYTMLNGRLEERKEHGIYPVLLLQTHEQHWPETMSKIFTVKVSDIQNVGTFVVASDGVKDQNPIQQQMLGWAHTETPDPDQLVTRLARIIRVPNGYRDDITVVALSM